MPAANLMLQYYEAIERASADMVAAARAGNWEQVVRIEGACVLLITQLKHETAGMALTPRDARLKTRIMQRILVNDAEIRSLAGPWVDAPPLDSGRPATLH